jgi:predicted membrane-bound spermidine synthase
MKLSLPRVTRFEVAAFITGFALLAYELTAARILAPTIGASMYVWTSVIGIIIAALSIGYAVGGILADRRVRSSDIALLLVGSATGMALTLGLYDAVLTWVSTSIPDPRVQGLVAATLLFAPTSFILGIISPYLARLRTHSLETTGTSVAFLSAANAIGGITGTFSVGFIFFGYIGSKETLVVTLTLLLACALLFVPIKALLKPVGISGIVLMVVALLVPQSYAQNEVASIDTPSEHYRIIESLYEARPVRLLISGPHAAQSGIFLNHSSELVFLYTRKMAELVDQAPARGRILILGGGAFTLPAYLADKYPSSQVDVVEIDPKLVDISKQYFNYRDRPNIRVYAQDARAYLETNRSNYDLILVDVYSDSSMPFSVTTQEYAARLKTGLRPGGQVIANVLGSDDPACAPLLRGVHASYQRQFDHYRLYPLWDPALKYWQNIIFVYSDQPLSGGVERELGGGMALTDNFAPVERLKLRCQGSQPN